MQDKAHVTCGRTGEVQLASAGQAYTEPAWPGSIPEAQGRPPRLARQGAGEGIRGRSLHRQPTAESSASHYQQTHTAPKPNHSRPPRQHIASCLDHTPGRIKARQYRGRNATKCSAPPRPDSNRCRRSASCVSETLVRGTHSDALTTGQMHPSTWVCGRANRCGREACRRRCLDEATTARPRVSLCPKHAWPRQVLQARPPAPISEPSRMAAAEGQAVPVQARRLVARPRQAGASRRPQTGAGGTCARWPVPAAACAAPRRKVASPRRAAGLPARGGAAAAGQAFSPAAGS